MTITYEVTDLSKKRAPEVVHLYLRETGLDGTPMPSYAGALTPEEIWAVVAYLDGLPPKDEWENLGKHVDEEIIGFNMERMHRRSLPPRGAKTSSPVGPDHWVPGLKYTAQH